jgi:hypothetical protein
MKTFRSFYEQRSPEELKNNYKNLQRSSIEKRAQQIEDQRERRKQQAEEQQARSEQSEAELRARRQQQAAEQQARRDREAEEEIATLKQKVNQLYS